MTTLKQYYDETRVEIGIDEVGRGPLFGRVYVAAVVLPKNDPSFQYNLLKDSKRFHSKKKIQMVAEYIKTNALYWSVQYETEDVIDKINILQATQEAMHKCVREILSKIKVTCFEDDVLLLIDGNYFNALNIYNPSNKKFEHVNHQCIEGGDNLYCSIAAASILAKVARDEYIHQLCIENRDLTEKYGIDSNKGYGAQRHIQGIKEHGITIWHRRTFGICKEYNK